MAVQENSKIDPLKLPLFKTGDLHNLHSYPHLLSATRGKLMVKTINYLIFLPPKVTHSSKLFMVVVSSIVHISVWVVYVLDNHFSSKFISLFFERV